MSVLSLCTLSAGLITIGVTNIILLVANTESDMAQAHLMFLTVLLSERATHLVLATTPALAAQFCLTVVSSSADQHVGCIEFPTKSAVTEVLVKPATR